MGQLDNIIDVKTASELWGLSPDRIKTLCSSGKITSKKIGNSWAIYKLQDNPKKRKKEVKIYAEN